MSTTHPVNIYAIFHLNLAFSSLDACAHHDVISRCYWPLLNTIEQKEIPLGIEITAYTLECIQNIDSSWVTKFKRLLSEKKCELLASGDSQIIGPLIPAELNRRNLLLGQKSYQALLGSEPKSAYINEQAVSSGLLDIYLDCGFESVVVEWDNPFSHNPDWSQEKLCRPQSLGTATNRSIKVIWNNAIAFQKLQRYAHGELVLDDYLKYLGRAVKPSTQVFSIYGSDAEVFDYRPGRYTSEASHSESNTEWERLNEMFTTLKNTEAYRWCLPSNTLSHWSDDEPLSISTASHPISVKKQAKYNITRWGLSGRNDLYLNTHCHRQFKQLDNASAPAPDKDWQTLCRYWASDLRTHLTQTRYSDLISGIGQHETFPTESEAGDAFTVNYDTERKRLHIASDQIRLVFNANRGLSIESLAFASQSFIPICGTLPHGHFDHIRYSADFYSNHLVMERFRERDRVTDLGFASYSITGNNTITTRIPTPHGELLKWYQLKGESLECGFKFASDERPEASLRLGYVTLLNCAERPWFSCHNGGYEREHYQATEDLDHGAPVSSIVSASSALGATTGEFFIGNQAQGLRLTWDLAQNAALPMVSSKKINDEYLNRFWFSLIEADETLKPGGNLPPFSYRIHPSQKPFD
ncbi:MAG: hypothetical protein K6L81_04995 [Agarilytica sp.]